MNTINDNLKEYKETPIGQIPIDWEIVPLHKIAKVIDGDRSSNYPSRDDFVEDGILFLSTKNIKGAFFDFTEKKFITQQKFNSINKGKLIKDDLVITMRGSIGNVARFLGDKYKTALINAQMSIIRPTSIGSEYLWTALNSFIIPRYLKKITTGSAQPQLTKKDVEKIPVIIPPLNEQRRIVTILSAWDKAIELKEKLIEQKKEQKKGLMQRLLTGEVRLPGFNDEWKKVTLSEICKLETGKRPKGGASGEGEIPSLGGENIYSNHGLNLSNIRKVSKEFYESMKSGHLKENDILINKDGAQTGKVALYKNTGLKKACINEHLFIVRPVGKISYKFLYYYLSSDEGQRKMKIRITSSAQPGLNSKFVNGFLLRIPNYEEQELIGNILLKSDKEILLIKKEKELLEQQKKGLMQLLLTGKIRIKV